MHRLAPVQVLREVLGLVLPDGCVGCGLRDAPAACTACAALLSVTPLPSRPTPAPPGLPPVVAVGPYAGELRLLLAGYKEQGRRSLAKPLGDALGDALAVVAGECSRGSAPGGQLPALAVPMPSARAAVRRRGRDTGRVLARRACRRARAHGVPVSCGCVLRLRRRVRDSAGLDARERAANLAGAYVVPPRLAAVLRGRRVFLLDDVMTTGATLAEATRAVRAAGGEVVGAAVVAATQRRAARPTHAA